MGAEAGARLLDGLPAVFRSSDAGGHLAQLLGVFEALLFTGNAEPQLPGIEQQVMRIPGLFSPQGSECGGVQIQTPDHLVHWLAEVLGFAPHALFHKLALRRIIAGIVPLYGNRGTRDYLEKLLWLCFEGEVEGIQVDDRPPLGFKVGESVIGRDTRFGTRRPYWFKVVATLAAQALARSGPDALERRLRAVIDFAKPAHTTYELLLQHRKPPAEPIAADAHDA